MTSPLFGRTPLLFITLYAPLYDAEERFASAQTARAICVATIIFHMLALFLRQEGRTPSPSFVYNVSAIFKKVGAPILTRWISFPPFFSFLLLIPTVLFHNREASFHVPPLIWGLVISVYICMCGISIFFIVKGDRRFNVGISALTQGMLLAVMALQSGAMFLSWIGLVLFLVGLFLIFYYATRGSASARESRAEDAQKASAPTTEKLLAKMNLPICYTDTKGIVSWASESFLAEIGRTQEEIVGAVIADVLPIDDETVTLTSGKWWITQVKEGARYYFRLAPTDGDKPQAVLETRPAASSKGPSIYEPNTGLYTDEYRRIRGPEEVMRAQRYKRSLSGMLIELTFHPNADVKLSDEQRVMLNTAFATKVKGALRAMDCGFFMEDHYRIQLLLPETPQAGAKTLMSRLLLLPQDVFEEDIRSVVGPKVKAGMFFYNGATKMEYSIFSATLEESFAKAREDSTGMGSAA